MKDDIIKSLVNLGASAFAGKAKKFLEDRKLDVFSGVLEEIDNDFRSTQNESVGNIKGKLKSLLSDIPEEFIDNFFDEGVVKLLDYISPMHISNTLRLDGHSIFVISDDSDHPFQINKVIKDTAKKICTGENSQREKAKALFDWMTKEVTFGSSRRTNVGYRTSTEVLKDKEGNCGEMTILYVVMARSVGLTCNFAKSSRGRHFYAHVETPSGAIVVDPSLGDFDKGSVGYKIYSDAEAVPYFHSRREFG